MDVTNENFEAVLKELETIIPGCDFAAIDMEFTGLSGIERFERSSSDQGPAASVPKDPDERHGTDEEMTNPIKSKDFEKKYQEVRSAGNFLVIQVGVCPFTWNEKSGEFIAHPFNFYTFPREVRGHDPRFSCQTTSMTFLAEKGHFDFNKLIRSGIPFLSQEQEAVVRNSTIVDPDGFIVELREKIIAFLIAGEPANLLLPPADSYRRKLTYQELGSTFKDVVTTERQCADSGEVCIRVSRIKHWNRILGSTPAQVRSAIAERARAAEERELWSAVGFRHVVDLLARAGKPLVGHNMLLDLAHLEAAFGQGSLPPDSDAFAAQLRRRFPGPRAFFDTKHLACAGPRSLAAVFARSGTALPAVYQALGRLPGFERPPVALARGFPAFARPGGGGGGGRAHEAGFDAFMTGLVFLKMAHYIMAHAPQAPIPDPAPAPAPAAARRADGAAESPVSPARAATGLTPRLRELGSVRPYARIFDSLVRFANRVHVLGCPGVASVHLTPEGATPDDGVPAPGDALDGPSPVAAVRPWSVPDWDDDPAPPAPAPAAPHGVPSAAAAAAPSRTPPGQARRPLDGWPSVGRSGSGSGSAGGGGGVGGGGGGNGSAGKAAGGQGARQRTRDSDGHLVPARPHGKQDKRPRVSM